MFSRCSRSLRRKWSKKAASRPGARVFRAGALLRAGFAAAFARAGALRAGLRAGAFFFALFFRAGARLAAVFLPAFFAGAFPRPVFLRAFFAGFFFPPRGADFRADPARLAFEPVARFVRAPAFPPADFFRAFPEPFFFRAMSDSR
jgi:hypothetical protein